jgi:hypothetical protein
LEMSRWLLPVWVNVTPKYLNSIHASIVFPPIFVLCSIFSFTHVYFQSPLS